ncbi:ANK1 [Symbiodinium sp. CCMP2592]|nr:ANK1 [Symbiodinium sp. CCMP2592]
MISVGDIAFVNYGEVPPCVHARLVGAHVHNDVFVIVTPDWDIYEEQLSRVGCSDSCADNPAHVYTFGALTAIEYQRLMHQASLYAAGLRAGLGLPAHPGAPAAAAPAAPVQAVAPVNPTVWVALESRGGTRAGSVVVQAGQPLPAGVVQQGDRAILDLGGGQQLCLKQIDAGLVGSMDAEDLRVLPLRFDPQGQRRAEFADMVALMKQVDMPGGKLQLDGPPSGLEVMKSMVMRGLTPVTDHEHWVRTHELAKGDRSVYEMEVITRVLEAMATVDQLNLPNLKGAELLIRRWQLIREAHRISPTSPDYSAADVFMGWAYRRGDGVDPSLAKYVAGELRDQASIAKEARKAKEEMEQRRKTGRPNPKGGGAAGGATEYVQPLRFDGPGEIFFLCLFFSPRVISALNNMAGFKFSSCGPPSQNQAVRELLLECPSSPYVSGGDGTGGVKAYQRDLVSLPECGAHPLDARELIDERGREVLERFESAMFVEHRVNDGSRRIKPYMDEALRTSAQAYNQFIVDIYERGMITFSRTAISVITPFFVAKKNGRLRLVLDCRASNQMFAAPPDIALAAGYTFAQIEVPQGEVLFTAQSDVKDYFHSIGLPPGLRPYFALPAVQANDLTGHIPLLEGFQGKVYPCMCVVPMGWSWSMWVAQRIHQHQAAIALQCGPDQVLVDGRPPPDLEKGQPVLIPYADNMNVCGIDAVRVQWAKDCVANRLREVGFRVHEEENASTRAQALGFIIDGERGQVQPIPARRDKVRLALLWLAGIGMCREMWRFKSKDPLNRARDAALSLDPFSDLHTVRDVTGMEHDPFQLNLQFEHVPSDVACNPEWKHQFACRMRMKEHITVLEGRGTLQAIRHKLRSKGNFQKRHVHLGDNLGMVLAFDRGRAKAVPLLMCCRRAAAFCIATCCTFTHRWVPSEFNAGDAGSRTWEREAPQEAGKAFTARIRDAIIYPNTAQAEIKEAVNQFLGRAVGDPEGFGGTQEDQRTSEEYRHKLDLFIAFCSAQKLPRQKPADVDWALLLFVNQAFLEGWDVSEGVKAVAAVTDYRPELGGKHALPRTRRAMQGWRNLDPGVTRPPLAWPLIALIALQMAEAGKLFECMAVLLMFVAYLRPGEVFGLRRRDLVKSLLLGRTWAINLHPSEDMQASKTDVNNESIMLDNKEIPWLGAVLEGAGAVLNGPLLPTSYTEVTNAWNQSLASLKLKKGLAVLHQLRHSGATWDRFKDYRTVLDVKLRGRWVSDSSLRRYEQHALVAQEFEKLSEALKTRARAAPSLLKSLLLGRCGLRH